MERVVNDDLKNKIIGSIDVLNETPATKIRLLEVLELYINGYSYEEIGEKLNIKSRTVTDYMNSVYKAVDAETLSVMRKMHTLKEDEKDSFETRCNMSYLRDDVKNQLRLLNIREDKKKRLLEFIELYCNGLSMTEIGERMSISMTTISSSYMREVYTNFNSDCLEYIRKLHCTSKDSMIDNEYSEIVKALYEEGKNKNDVKMIAGCSFPRVDKLFNELKESKSHKIRFRNKMRNLYNDCYDEIIFLFLMGLCIKEIKQLFSKDKALTEKIIETELSIIDDNIMDLIQKEKLCVEGSFSLEIWQIVIKMYLQGCSKTNIIKEYKFSKSMVDKIINTYEKLKEYDVTTRVINTISVIKIEKLFE